MKSFLAAVMMFTRIPLWRIVQVDKKHYTGILLYWPVVGFLTGLTTWGVLRLTTPYVPALVACVLAVIARILLTGALHEDGFGDFCDGFGGGHGKESILRTAASISMNMYRLALSLVLMSAPNFAHRS